MKIAFCFLTRGDLFQPKVWESFFSSAPLEKYTIYCHPKEPEHVASPILSGRIINDRVPTRHGDVSIVKATLNLFSTAHNDDEDNQYFVLVSESTIPIVSFDYLYKSVERNGSHSITSYNVPPPNIEHHQRLFTVKQRELFSSAFFSHDQWIILHRQHVSMLLDHPSLALFNNVFAPDEHYFMNALVHLKGASLDQFVNQRATFVNWRDKVIKTYTSPETGQVLGRTVHPKTYHQLSAADIKEARNGDCWFFRKVDAECDCTIVTKHLLRAARYQA
jgi:hypothetical protein